MAKTLAISIPLQAVKGILRRIGGKDIDSIHYGGWLALGTCYRINRQSNALMLPINLDNAVLFDTKLIYPYERFGVAIEVGGLFLQKKCRK